MARRRNAKIIATLGPSSSDRTTIEALYHAGADVFRLNLSHGTHADHKQRYDTIRAIERDAGSPIGVLLDLQGPKLRIGVFSTGPITLEPNATFRLDLDTASPGDATRVALPHPEIFAALRPGTALLLDDGRIRLNVERCGPDFAQTTVITGGVLSERKGVNIPDVILPVAAITEKDRRDLEFGLSLGVNWVALSFVQRVEDILEVRRIVRDRAGILAKLEKPAAIRDLEGIVEAADAVMVARGDLGVEIPPERVPAIQKQIVRACRNAGKPVIIATQMLESMVGAPVPTRAEASDVATAVYDGVDAVMLSAESAAGGFPIESVRMMDRIICRTEDDPHYREGIVASRCAPRTATSADAIGHAIRHLTTLLNPVANVAYTSSGYSAMRLARERPLTRIISMTPHEAIAQRLALVWGLHPVVSPMVVDPLEVSDLACDTVRTEGLGAPGQTVVVSAGMPFGTPGTTNLLHIATIRRPQAGHHDTQARHQVFQR